MTEMVTRVFLVGIRGPDRNDVRHVCANPAVAQFEFDKICDEMIADRQEGIAWGKLQGRQNQRYYRKLPDEIAALKSGDVQRMAGIMHDVPYIEQRDLED